jgi:hypothetical protein
LTSAPSFLPFSIFNLCSISSKQVFMVDFSFINSPILCVFYSCTALNSYSISFFQSLTLVSSLSALERSSSNFFIWAAESHRIWSFSFYIFRVAYVRVFDWSYFIESNFFWSLDNLASYVFFDFSVVSFKCYKSWQARFNSAYFCLSLVF